MDDEERKQSLFGGNGIVYDSMPMRIYTEAMKFVEENDSLRFEGSGEVRHHDYGDEIRDVRIGVTSTNSDTLSENVRGALKGLNNIVFGELSMAPAFRKGGFAHKGDSEESSE